MSHVTKYNGPAIDAALEKGRSLRVVNNGWILLESSEMSPVDLGTIKTSGNYQIFYFVDGPGFDDPNTRPINLTVVTINGVTYQFASVGKQTYARRFASNLNRYGIWSIDQSVGAINPGPSAPSDPIDDTTIWMDTSIADKPTLKIYHNGVWIDVIPEDVMQKSVYDPNGECRDIFAYVDQSILDANFGNINIDFASHVDDDTLHITEDDRAVWASAATDADIEVKKKELEERLSETIKETVGDRMEEINDYATKYVELDNNLKVHEADTSMHPTLEQQAYWDAKLDGDHTHYLDPNVVVDASKIEGTIPPSVVPDSAKERTYVVKGENESMLITADPLHSGDSILQVGDETSDTVRKWSFVTDESKLPTWIKPEELGEDTSSVVTVGTENKAGTSDTAGATFGVTSFKGGLSDNSEDLCILTYSGASRNNDMKMYAHDAYIQSKDGTTTKLDVSTLFSGVPSDSNATAPRYIGKFIPVANKGFVYICEDRANSFVLRFVEDKHAITEEEYAALGELGVLFDVFHSPDKNTAFSRVFNHTICDIVKYDDIDPNYRILKGIKAAYDVDNTKGIIDVIIDVEFGCSNAANVDLSFDALHRDVDGLNTDNQNIIYRMRYDITNKTTTGPKIVGRVYSAAINTSILHDVYRANDKLFIPFDTVANIEGMYSTTKETDVVMMVIDADDTVKNIVASKWMVLSENKVNVIMAFLENIVYTNETYIGVLNPTVGDVLRIIYSRDGFSWNNSNISFKDHPQKDLLTDLRPLASTTFVKGLADGKIVAIMTNIGKEKSLLINGEESYLIAAIRIKSAFAADLTINTITASSLTNGKTLTGSNAVADYSALAVDNLPIYKNGDITGMRMVATMHSGTDNFIQTVFVPLIKVAGSGAFVELAETDTEVSWDDIKNKPTTIEELGISNAVSKAELADLNAKIAETNAKIMADHIVDQNSMLVMSQYNILRNLEYIENAYFELDKLLARLSALAD